MWVLYRLTVCAACRDWDCPTVLGVKLVQNPDHRRRRRCRITVLAKLAMLSVPWVTSMASSTGDRGHRTSRNGVSLRNLAMWLKLIVLMTNTKAPLTLSRNEREPAGITIFKIRDTFGRDSHLFKKNRNAVGILRIHCEPASNDSCTFGVH